MTVDSPSCDGHGLDHGSVFIGLFQLGCSCRVQTWGHKGGALVELTLLAGVETGNWAQVAHHASPNFGVPLASGALVLLTGQVTVHLAYGESRRNGDVRQAEIF